LLVAVALAKPRPGDERSSSQPAVSASKGRALRLPRGRSCGQALRGCVVRTSRGHADHGTQLIPATFCRRLNRVALSGAIAGPLSGAELPCPRRPAEVIIDGTALGRRKEVCARPKRERPRNRTECSPAGPILASRASVRVPRLATDDAGEQGPPAA